MDYKATSLPTKLKVDTVLLPEIEGLYFVTLDEEKTLFDYTAYFENNGLQPIDYKSFMRANKPYIEAIANITGRDTSQMFFINADNHVLVSNELVFLFLAFSNPDLLGYFNSLIQEVLTQGVAYSDTFAAGIASERVPTEVLKDIIKDRENNAETQQLQ